MAGHGVKVGCSSALFRARLFEKNGSSFFYPFCLESRTVMRQR
ncbi:hypothetical protein HMPREF9124_0643 [Oribacterium sp. oral taxon 108 str. F0425]|nr:hypothetical protein HMPREF9124_0643 [Oribacterium sp. oral taxon 108 str. F0425]